MHKLRSTTGCLVCRQRRKKCDEQTPCGNCRRLGLICHPRSSALTLTSYNLKGRPQVLSYHPPFESNLQRDLVRASPGSLSMYLGGLADPSFRDMRIFGAMAACDMLVRDAVVAYTSTLRSAPRELTLRHYQKCVTTLRQDWMRKSLYNSESAMVAIFFMAILEDIHLVDPAVSLQHYIMLGRMLSHRCQRPIDALIDVCKFITEAAIYKLNSLARMLEPIPLPELRLPFDEIFRDSRFGGSPFMGGMQQIYHLGYEIARYLACPEAFHHDEILGWSGQLDGMEARVATLYQTGGTTVRRYGYLHLLNILALRIQVLKINQPSSTYLVAYEQLVSSIRILKQHDLRQTENPTLTLPLAIFLCAAVPDDDFDFMCRYSRDFQGIIDTQSSKWLRSVENGLRSFRTGGLRPDGIDDAQNQFDYVLHLHRLGAWGAS